MSKTEENLKAAFAGESQARNMYTYFAKVARKEGYHYIAKIFEETAINEMRHAKDEFALLGGIGDTIANLKEAIAGEHYETTTMYPEFAAAAKEEGNKEAAILFNMIARVEAEHRDRYRSFSRWSKTAPSISARNRSGGSAQSAVISTKAKNRRRSAPVASTHANTTSRNVWSSRRVRAGETRWSRIVLSFEFSVFGPPTGSPN